MRKAVRSVIRKRRKLEQSNGAVRFSEWEDLSSVPRAITFNMKKFNNHPEIQNVGTSTGFGWHAKADEGVLPEGNTSGNNESDAKLASDEEGCTDEESKMAKFGRLCEETGEMWKKYKSSFLLNLTIYH